MRATGDGVDKEGGGEGIMTRLASSAWRGEKNEPAGSPDHSPALARGPAGRDCSGTDYCTT